MGQIAKRHLLKNMMTRHRYVLHTHRFPTKHAIICLDWTRTAPMLPASARFWPSQSWLWHVCRETSSIIAPDTYYPGTPGSREMYSTNLMLKLILRIYILGFFFRHLTKISATVTIWGLISIGSDIGLLPVSTKPLPIPMLTYIYVATRWQWLTMY